MSEVLRYIDSKIGKVTYRLLDLDQKLVDREVIADMDAGVDVYYDRRWEVTSILTDWLEKNHSQYEGKRVLVLGAGVGAETLVLGRLAEKVYLNDLSSIALKLCGWQMEHNGYKNYEVLKGLYEQITLPKVDVILASFLVYNKETLAAFRTFIRNAGCQFILMNENLKEFQQLLIELEHEVLFEVDGAKCVLIHSIRAQKNNL